MVKWIAALLGYSFFRFPGALLGFFLGSLLDQFNRGSTSYFKTSSSTLSLEKFQLNLLSLAATIIKADGQIKPQELQFVRNFFITNYGTQRASSIFETFNEQIKKKLQNTTDLAQFFMRNSRYETRLQIIHFLFGVANADGKVSQLELDKLVQIAAALGIASADFQSIQAMFVKATDNAYKILDITSNATNEEVKKAYRVMAKKYHPDKIQSQDPAMIKGAKEKFQEVQKAYETIQNERNM
ncbi:MAG: TerB family tellurite resistance protein [Flavobacteriaceae bacterium]|jgi:DnaJ like chaperone protein|nr:molecular chaperone DjiA [Flavobacteriia bacterium]